MPFTPSDYQADDDFELNLAIALSLSKMEVSEKPVTKTYWMDDPHSLQLDQEDDDEALEQALFFSRHTEQDEDEQFKQAIALSKQDMLVQHQVANSPAVMPSRHGFFNDQYWATHAVHIKISELDRTPDSVHQQNPRVRATNSLFNALLDSSKSFVAEAFSRFFGEAARLNQTAKSQGQSGVAEGRFATQFPFETSQNYTGPEYQKYGKSK